MKKIIIFLLLSLVSSLFASDYRPIRLAEVEDYYIRESSRSLEKVLGAGKFLLNVKVVPQRLDSQPRQERLPLFYENQNISDPWEDVEFPFYGLLRRVSSVRVHLVIDQRLKISDISSLREQVLKDAKLIPGRDEVIIAFEQFPTEKLDFLSYLLNPILMASLLLISGLAIVGYILSSRIAKQFSIPTSSSGGNFAASSPSPMLDRSFVQASSSQNDARTGGGNSFVELSSSLKQLPNKVMTLAQTRLFPSLGDLILLEDLLKKDVSAFTYFVNLVPFEPRNSIYANGRSEHWIEAFCDAGIPSQEVVMIVERMLLNLTLVRSKEVEEVLITLWRCSDSLDRIFSTNDKQSVSLALLSHLPKDLSLPVAKNLYPGNWADVLTFQDLDAFDINDLNIYKERALKMKPLFDEQAMKTLVERKDLFGYLDFTSPEFEHDVYKVLGRDSDISKLRAPFFPLFDVSESEFEMVISSFNLAQIALVCLEIPRKLRGKIEDLMNEKQKEMFIEYLKSYDKNRPSVEEVAMQRRMVAAWMAKNLKQQQAADNENDEVIPQSINEKVSDGEQNSNAA